MNFNLPKWTNTPETPITAEELNAMVNAIQHLLDNRSQVGDIVCNSNLDTMEKVIERFGGIKWERIEGRFLLGASSEYPIGTTGGEVTHTLTTEEIPHHSHPFGNLIASWPTDTNDNHDWGVKYDGGDDTHPYTTWLKQSGGSGGGQPHNNMPPYIAVYIWERTE